MHHFGCQLSNLQCAMCIRIEGHGMACKCTLSVLFHIALFMRELVVLLCPWKQLQQLLMAVMGIKDNKNMLNVASILCYCGGAVF